MVEETGAELSNLHQNCPVFLELFLRGVLLTVKRENDTILSYI